MQFKYRGWLKVETNKKVSTTKKRRPPAVSPEIREQQLVSLAYDEVEKRLRDGTASSQIIHYLLKKGSPTEKLERAKLIGENNLIQAKVKSIESGEKLEKLYNDAIEALKDYKGGE